MSVTISAKEAQASLGVADLELVACGHSRGKMAIAIWFEGGRLVRRESRHGVEISRQWARVFAPTFFTVDVKALTATNSRLAKLLLT